MDNETRMVGPTPTIPFREVWLVDFEFRFDGGRQIPLCMVAREYFSKREHRLWRDELAQLTNAPFNTGRDCCFVAYMAAAELNCFLALGWTLPMNVLDLAQEHKLSVNVGRRSKISVGWGLTDALRYRKQVHAMADEKPELVALILAKDTFSAAEQTRILDYCASDVTALAHLLPAMLPEIDWPRAIGFRGRYMKAVARMETAGIPFDTPLYERIKAHLPLVERELIKQGDAATYCYRDDGSFSIVLFEEFLAREGLEWDRTESGRPRLDTDYIKRRAAGCPKLRDFHELRGALNLLRGLDKTSQPELSDGSIRRSKILSPSTDGFIRCSLWAFGSATGRNQPQASQFAFGPATWMRGLIKPPPGHGIAYIDWSQQEFALAAGLSGDGNMMAAYRSGDVYMAFAIAAGMAPAGATKKDPAHAKIRDACKSVVLGMSYGKGFASIARDANIPPTLAKTLYDSHKQTYALFWQWIDGVITTTVLRDRFIQTRWGWRQIYTPETKTLSLLNFPMQAHGAVMMQMAAIAATEQGLHVCCPVHDAFLIMAPLETLEADVQAMQAIMAQAAKLVAKVDVRSAATVVRYPHRYMDDRGASMWLKVMSLTNPHYSKDF